MENAKIKINLSTGEIEISGSEEFVNSHLENIQDIVSSIPDSLKSNAKTATSSRNVKEEQKPKSEELASKSLSNTPDIFGEWYHSFQEDLSDPEKCLITAFFVQNQSEDNEFKTREVTKLLKEHGIILSNTSASIGRLKDKKQIFQTRKDGNVKFMRVSKTGEAEIENLKK